MKKLMVLGGVITTVLLSQGLFADDWGSAKINKEVRLALADKAIIQLNIDVGAGDLSIMGKSNQSEIQVIAKVYGEDLNEDEYTLSLEKVDDKAVLVAHFKNNTYNNERIDLEVSLPSSMALIVDDRSGDVLIQSVSNGLTLNDRSGDIELKNIAGLVKIEDRSGDVIGQDIRGDMLINDRSGDIQLEDIEGNVNIDDSSGDIRVKQATGIVTVDDSSGDIDIDGATDFILKSDGSGDVYLRNIQRDMK